MEEGDGKSAETASVVDAEEQQHEHHLGTLYYAGKVFKHQTFIECLCILGIQRCYLLVDILDGLRMACPEFEGPPFQARNTTDYS